MGEIIKQKQKLTTAEKRYTKAASYLKSIGVNIDSLADMHYKIAVKIAAGIK